MTASHIFQIEKLKNNFDNIITMKKDIRALMASMRNKLSELKTLHNELIKTNHKQIFLFCLDSFFYQYKIFSMELDNIEKLRCLFNNRMYCDYYKLHNIILKYLKEYRKECNEDIDHLVEPKTYPVYKDLEPFLQYDIEDIRSIHGSILDSINYLHKCNIVKSESIVSYNQHHKIGFSISNFLNTLTHENRVLHEQIVLYVNYISFFHISQKKQLSRLCARIQDFGQELDANININHAFSIEDIIEEHIREPLFDNHPITSSEDVHIETNPSLSIQDPTNTNPVNTILKPTEIKSEKTVDAGANDHIFEEKNIDNLPKFTPLTLSETIADGNISPLSESTR